MGLIPAGPHCKANRPGGWDIIPPIPLPLSMGYPSKQNRLWGTGAYVNKGGHLMFKGKPDGARCKMRLVCVPR